jgi:hypothetical protein
VDKVAFPSSISRIMNYPKGGSGKTVPPSFAAGGLPGNYPVYRNDLNLFFALGLQLLSAKIEKGHSIAKAQKPTLEDGAAAHVATAAVIGTAPEGRLLCM